MVQKVRAREVAWDEWVRCLEINLYGTFLPCRHAITRFKKSGYGKIINLSGGGATNPLPNISAYAASKAAVVRLTETLAEELRAFRVDVNAVAPGALNTRLLDEVLQAGPEKVGADFYARALKQSKEGGVPLELGADLCLYLASLRATALRANCLAQNGIRGLRCTRAGTSWTRATFTRFAGLCRRIAARSGN